MLKVIKGPGDEWRCGEMLDAFDGNGVARVYEFTEGAALIERLDPGQSLAGMAMSGRDDETTGILAGVIRGMSPHHFPPSAVPVQSLAIAFDNYLSSGNLEIARTLVEQARDVYGELCASQTRERLLHGDLHHYNVLLDRSRGWLAIDPKGVIGEIEYEVGAALRNPYERPDLFAAPDVIQARLRCFETALGLNPARALAWGFAQAVLAAIWLVEDGSVVDAEHPFLVLAAAIRTMRGEQV